MEALERLTTGRLRSTIPMSWSPDGKLLYFFEVNPTTGYDLWVQRMDGPATSSGQAPSDGFRPGPQCAAFPSNAIQRKRCQSSSPDRHWLAYVSDESGRYEIYVQPYPGPGGEVANLDGREHGASSGIAAGGSCSTVTAAR